MLPWGFVLLEEVEATLGSRNQSILYVELGHLSLEGPLLTALGSRLTRQQDERVTLRLQRVKCDRKESVDAHNTVLFNMDGDVVEMENDSQAEGHLVLIAGRPIGKDRRI